MAEFSEDIGCETLNESFVKVQEAFKGGKIDTAKIRIMAAMMYHALKCGSPVGESPFTMHEASDIAMYNPDAFLIITDVFRESIERFAVKAEPDEDGGKKKAKTGKK